MRDRLGDYRILREISRGGMGVVYLAEQVSLHRQVALKVLQPSSGLSQRHLDRFKREAEALGRLHHPNIVPVYGIGEDAGIHYFSMKYIEGRTLDAVIDDLRRVADTESKRPAGNVDRALTDRLRRPTTRVGEATVLAPQPTPAAAAPPARDPRTSPPDAPPRREARSASAEPRTDRSYVESVVRIVRDVARALHFAHEQGIIHRDVKPHNVILDADGTAYVMDFGLARDEATGGRTLTQSGDVFGTPLYMSPEQVSGRRSEIGPRTDVYSLGCTLYELLTLRPAFDGDTSEEILRRILLAEPRRPRLINRRLPPDLENVTLRAIEKSPDKRYATAAEFADDLDRFLNYEAVRASAPSAVETILRAVRRYRAVSAALAVALLASLAFVWLLFVRSGTLVVETVFVDGDEDRPFLVASDVRLDERFLGSTPVFASVRPGRYALRVSPEDPRYKAEEQAVEIRAGAQSTVRFQLRRAQAELIVSTRPPDALVRVVRKDRQAEDVVSHGPEFALELPDGVYDIDASARGFMSEKREKVVLRAGWTERIEFGLRRDLPAVYVDRSVDVAARSSQGAIAQDPPKSSEDPWLLEPGKWTFRTAEDNVIPESVDFEVSQRRDQHLTLRATEFRKWAPFTPSDEESPLAGAPALDDLDRDGVLDVIAVSASGEVVIVHPPRAGAPRRTHRVARLKAKIATLPVLASLEVDARSERFAFVASTDGRVFAVTVAIDGAIRDVEDVVAETLVTPGVEAQPLGVFLLASEDDHLLLAIPYRNGPLAILAFDGTSFSERPADAGVVLGAAPAASDVDGDGVADLLLETDHGVELLSGQDGSLLVGLEAPPRKASARSPILLLDDLTGDGRAEALVARDRRVTCYPADGGGPLWTSGDLGELPVESLVVLPARTVGSDVAVFTAKSARFLSGSDGLEQRDRQLTHVRDGKFVGALALDLDGNGSEEVVIALDTGVVVVSVDNLWVYSPAAGDEPPVAVGPIAGDVDGDGALEILVGLRDGGIHVLRGNVPRRKFRFDLPASERDHSLVPTIARVQNDVDQLVVVSRPDEGGESPAGDEVFVVDSRDGSYKRPKRATSLQTDPLVVTFEGDDGGEKLLCTGDESSVLRMNLSPAQRLRIEDLGWLEGRTFLADFDQDRSADLVRVDLSGLLVFSGVGGQKLQQVVPFNLQRVGETGGAKAGFTKFPGALTGPISALFQDADGDGLVDAILGFPSGEEDVTEPRRLIAITWPEGRRGDPRLLWDVIAPGGLSPRLSRDASTPGAPLLVTWHEGTEPSAPFRGAALLDPATGVTLRDAASGEDLAIAAAAVPREPGFEPVLLGVLSRAEAGRTILIVRTGPGDVTAIALDGDDHGPEKLFAEPADVSWLARSGSEIVYVRDPDPIGLVHLAAGNRLMVFDLASGRLASRHVIPEPVQRLVLRRDASGALVAVYVSGRDLLTACAVLEDYRPVVWGGAERSVAAAARAGDLVETIARVAELRRGTPREREKGATEAARVLERHLGRDARSRGRLDPATADLLRVLANVAR